MGTSVPASPDAEWLQIEVAFASPQVQRIVTLRVTFGTTVGEAIRASGLLSEFPELKLSDDGVGIFARRCNLSQILEHGDRVEMYRPLTDDPKAIRRRRAERALREDR